MTKIEDFIAAYVEARKEGLSNKELAKKLGITPSSVSTRIQKLIKAGVKIEPLGTKNIKQKILKVVEQNKENPQEEILRICSKYRQYSRKLLPYLRKLKNPVFTEEFKNQILTHFI